MQPLNDKLAALAGTGTDGKGTATTTVGDGQAVEIATQWIKGNYYRLLVPMVSGGLSLYQALFV